MHELKEVRNEPKGTDFKSKMESPYPFPTTSTTSLLKMRFHFKRNRESSVKKIFKSS